MMSKTCDRCKFWGYLSRYGHLIDGPLGRCNSPKFILGYSHVDDQEAMPDGVRVEDDEGWGFVTAPKFGCIHWAEKDSAGVPRGTGNGTE